MLARWPKVFCTSMPKSIFKLKVAACDEFKQLHVRNTSTHLCIADRKSVV